MSVTLASLILNQDDTVYEAVECPEWKDDKGKPITLVVRSLTGAEKDDYEASLLKVTKRMKRGKVTREADPNFENARAKLVALSVCVDKGNPERVFSDEQVKHLGKKNGAALDRLYAVASRLSAVSENDLEEMLGNGEKTPDGKSG